MTTKSTSDATRSLIPWKKRTSFQVAKSRRARQRQYDSQINMLLVLGGATIVFGILFIFINWQNAGSAKAVSCAEYPQYCVPFAGGGTGNNTGLEAARKLDEESHGVDNVVRYIAEDNVPTIGDPDAAFHIRVVSNFGCGHCNTYHTGDLERIIEDFALTGQTTVGFALVTNTGGGSYAETAALSALCAADQGAFWEMADELFRLARAGGTAAFNPDEIAASADDMALDADDLKKCTVERRYAPILQEHALFATNNGVSGTPTVLVRRAGEDQWTRLQGADRLYDNVAALIQAANDDAAAAAD